METESGVTRLPVAWRHRDIHLPRPMTYYQHPHPGLPHPSHLMSSHISHPPSHHHHHHQPPPHPSASNQRTSSPSVLTTSSDDREEVPMVRHPPRRHNGGSVYSQTIDRRRPKHLGQQLVPRSHIPRGSIISHGPGPMRGYRTATLRSTRSFPGLMMTTAVPTWDGEPCPVHGGSSHLHSEPTPSIITAPVIPSHHPHLFHHHPHHHQNHPYHAGSSLMTVKRFNSLSDLRRPSLTPLIAYNGSGGGLINDLSKPLGTKLPLPQYFGTMFRTAVPSSHSSMVPGQIMIPAPIEAIKNQLANANKMMQSNPMVYDDTVCCKGHLIVLWIILAVVTFGVISGIILGVTAN